MTGFIEGGKLTPIVDRTYALADTAEACAAWSRDTRAARSLSTWREMRRRPLLEERAEAIIGQGGPGVGARCPIRPRAPPDHILERDSLLLRGVGHRLGDQHLALPRIVGDPRREVDGLAEEVALLEEDRPRVQSDVGWGQPRDSKPVHHLEGGMHAGAGVGEVGGLCN